jgi:hypothetical protein
MIFIIYKKKYIGKRYTGRANWPFITLSAKSKNIARTLQHELIHWAQIKELWVLKFYWKYWRFHKKHGYRHNPFEVEAYRHAEEEDYLETREKFAWKKYVQKGEV